MGNWKEGGGQQIIIIIILNEKKSFEKIMAGPNVREDEMSVS